MKIEIDESTASALSMMIWHMVGEANKALDLPQVRDKDKVIEGIKALEGLVHEIDIQLSEDIDNERRC